MDLSNPSNVHGLILVTITAILAFSVILSSIKSGERTGWIAGVCLLAAGLMGYMVVTGKFPG